MQTQASTEHFVDIGGSDVGYLDVGAGPPLLLVHGLGHSSTAWQRSIERLSSDRRAIVADLPGFGRSSAPRDLDRGEFGAPQYFASVVGALVDRLALSPCDAVGHSAGALALLLDAAASPGRYRRLILVNPAGFTTFPDNAIVNSARTIAGILLRLARVRWLRRALYATAFSDHRRVDEATVDELMRRQTDPAALQASHVAFEQHLAFCRDLTAFHERLRALVVPMLVIWGGDDRLFRARTADVVRRVLPHARIEVFERCGHCPHIECPDRFVAAVKEFLTSP